jgi:hypothetical protein
VILVPSTLATITALPQESVSLFYETDKKRGEPTICSSSSFKPSNSSVTMSLFRGAPAALAPPTVAALWRSRRSLSSVTPLALSVMTEGAGAPTGTCTRQYSSAHERISRSLSDGSRAKDGLYREDRARSTRFNRTAMAFF